MGLVEELLGPLSLDEFRRTYLYQKPYASPSTALSLRKLISWPLLDEIFQTGHPDCWLPYHGQLPKDETLNTGQLTLAQALGGFSEGRTVLVRHSERAHPKLQKIAAEFHAVFQDPVDIQLYVTPPEQEGFDWHYDIEEVFVVQSSGEKEFLLRQAARPVPLNRVELPKTVNFALDFTGPEIRCHMKAGDLLYIPAGFWHKARAITPSFHLSVGVLHTR